MSKIKHIHIPKSEKQQYYSESHFFGICDACNTALRYPGIQFPKEVIETGGFSGMTTYDIKYFTYHTSCATKKLLESGNIDLKVEPEISCSKAYIETFLAWIIKKFNISINCQVIVDTISTKIGK